MHVVEKQWFGVYVPYRVHVATRWVSEGGIAAGRKWPVAAAAAAVARTFLTRKCSRDG